MYSGELDGKGRWSTWSFKMKSYCAVMAPGLGEVMGSASLQELDIRQDGMTSNDGAHSANLYYILSLLTDGEALDIAQNSTPNNEMEVWRRMVTCLGSKSVLEVPRDATSNLVFEMGHVQDSHLLPGGR